MSASRHGERYCPSNGTEMECFTFQWCDKCVRDQGAANCGILTRAILHRFDDPEFPTEWIYDDEGEPCCTAFKSEREPPKPYRCKKTSDLFEGRS